MDGRVSEAFFRRSVVWLVDSRFAGTLLAKVLLLTAALVILALATHL